MKLLLTYLKEYRFTLFITLILAVINQLFALIDPQIARLILDRYATHPENYSQAGFIQGVLILLLAAIGVAFVSRVAKSFQDYYVSLITQKVSTKLYSDSIEHSFSLPYSSFEDQRSGELLQKLQKARTDSQTLITNLINIVFLSLVGITFVVIYAFMVHWTIGLLYLFLIPILAGFNLIITRKIKTIQKNIIGETAALAGSTTETLRNVELVKSLGLEEQEIARLNDVNDKILNLELKKIKTIRTLSFIQGTFINAMRSLLLLVMLILIFYGKLSVGEYFTLLIYSFFIFNPLADFGNVSTQYQETKASLDQLNDILTIPVEEKNLSPEKLSTINSVMFEKVGFSYETSKKETITNINIEIKKGETVAFVGPSGAGKSTLIKLLVGLYHPTSGTLKINHTNIEKLDRRELRKKIGLVAQETQLFAGTIRENLLFVNPQATDEDCLRALEQASAIAIIKKSGDGLNSKIGEGGIKISGGERQRLAIARALLRQPEMIIFDEATSSLDSITEKAITQTIKEITLDRPNTISIMIAHRLSTIAHAQRIYVLERGKIIETGNHEELLAKGGLYSALWREQSAA